ncbi:hypothetical protein ACIRBY_32185 [Streptomyces sp. NPDC096136]|uniref:hypothetical protein n=1 Tax=Streptomyces sp. NPDC096136 TaxID=3366076 RepID=UPI0038236CD3
MRLRNSLAAAVGALTLVLTLPNSASAAVGTFEYTYFENGHARIGALVDPAGEDCIDIPGATDADPAQAPKNLTNATATVFLDFGCQGDTFYVMNPLKILGPRLKLRSVVFSH